MGTSDLPSPRVLHAEDDVDLAAFVRTVLEHEGISVQTAPNGMEFWRSISESVPDLCLLDLGLPDVSGHDLLRGLSEKHPEVPRIVITASTATEDVVQAMKSGAVDYVTKPIDPQRLLTSLRNALRHAEQTCEIARLRRDIGQAFRPDHLVGVSPQMVGLRKEIQKVGAAEMTVLITGETGTGKELVAHALHSCSTRQDGPYIDVNSAALTETLLESELFGHEKGAFTGASSQRRGQFEQAHGGTLFLDEIGDMPPSTQSKILRVLQEHRLKRVGGEKSIDVDVRVICATHRNLDLWAKEGRFRQDLLYRINAYTIELSPLRERVEDIPVLAKHFAERACRRQKVAGLTISPPAIEILTEHPWPGNVRELEHAMERAVLLCEGGSIRPQHLPSHLRDSPAPDSGASPIQHLIPAVEALERKMILHALATNDGVKARAARELGISKRMIAYKMMQLGIDRNE